MCEKEKGKLDPFDLSRPIEIVLAPDAKTARSLVKSGGFCPVECSFGDESVVDVLEMDHHGPLSHLEGVAVRSYRDYYGVRADDPRFVVTGTPDEDATFAIASLAGKIPHPALAEQFIDSSLKTVWASNYQHVAEIINKADINPKEVDLLNDYWGRLVVYWRETTNLTIRDASAFHAGVVRWRDILTTPQDKLIEIVPNVVEASLKFVRAAPFEEISKKVIVVDCSQWGFSYTYAAEWHKHSPIVLAFYGATYGEGYVTICAKDKTTAERLFGKTGFLNIYDKLEEAGFKGCGGREDIGGSDRGAPMKLEDAIELGKALNSLIIPAKKTRTRKTTTKKVAKKDDETSKK